MLRLASPLAWSFSQHEAGRRGSIHQASRDHHGSILRDGSAYASAVRITRRPKVDWVHFVGGLEGDETSSSYELRRGSLPPEDLSTSVKNAGDVHGKHAGSSDVLSPQCFSNL